MSFNISRYNLQPYNIPAVRRVKLKASVETNFKFSWTTIYWNLQGNVLERLISDNIVLDHGYLLHGSGAENFENDSASIAKIQLKENPNIIFSQEINISQIAHLSKVLTEKFTPNFKGYSVNIYLSKRISEVINQIKVNLSQIVHASGQVGEIFTETADVITLHEYICDLSGFALKPGQVLIVDAGTYNVTLDGENAIWLQKG